MRAIAYTRVSTEEQAREGVSLAAQRKRLRAYVTAQGLTLVEVFEDEGVSAAKPLVRRPQGNRLVAALATGHASHVLALKLDRLFRDAVDCLRTAGEWDRKGIALHLVDLGGQAVNTATAMGRFFLTVMAGEAEMERNLIRERTRFALAHKQRLGELVGAVPLGLRLRADGRHLEVSPEELLAVERIISLRQAGTSFRAIAASLDADGFATKQGGQWAPATVHRVWAGRARYAPFLRQQPPGDAWSTWRPILPPNARLGHPGRNGAGPPVAWAVPPRPPGVEFRLEPVGGPSARSFPGAPATSPIGTGTKGTPR